MNPSSVKVSIIIPTFNRAQYVCEAIDSVLAQTFKDHEIIVVDDGSTDNTSEVLKIYGDQIRCFSQKNRGLSAARNLGMSLSRGEYIAFLDDDDVWLPEKLEKQVQILDNSPELGFVCSEAYVFNNDKQILEHWKRGRHNQETFESLFEENFVSVLTVVMRRRCFEEIGDFDESLIFSEDYDYWLRLSLKYKFQYMNIPLAKYRFHNNQMSKNLDDKMSDCPKIFNKKEIAQRISFLKRKIRLAGEYYRTAGIFYSANNFIKAKEYFLRSIFTYPLIGKYFWPQETERARFSLPYRILKVYILIFECMLNTSTKKV